MREITVKYQGECKKCGAVLDVGNPAMYEKSMGCFCIGCEPKDVEAIRQYRLEKAERKAARYEEWAEKREAKANSQNKKTLTLKGDVSTFTADKCLCSLVKQAEVR